MKKITISLVLSGVSGRKIIWIADCANRDIAELLARSVYIQDLLSDAKYTERGIVISESDESTEESESSL